MAALSGVKILELAESVSGEYCGKLLADFGAEVIKIETPGVGSPTRRMGPFKVQPASAPGSKTSDARNVDVESSGLFAYLNTGKQSIELDLLQNKSILSRLLSQVDAVIDDHSLEWLSALGLHATQQQHMHSGLVVCSISNFGLEPPQDRLHAEDLNVFHSSGWGFHTPTGGDPALPPLNGAGRFLPSYEAGLEAALCISAALLAQRQTGEGQFIEISKQEVLASRVDYVLAQMVGGDMNVSQCRSAFDLSGPAGIFPCEDGFVYIWLSAPAHWQGLRQLLGDPAWMHEFPENWLEKACTPERVATCRRHLVQWLKTQGKQQAAEQAQKLGVTLVAVNNAADLVNSPQYQFREFFVGLEHPVLGNLKYPTVPYRMSETPAKPLSPAPLLGQRQTLEWQQPQTQPAQVKHND
ncbi:CaiB/BaiF CoA transferase family protein [Ketobacter sp.]|uniref:CaiB/BaiF CoA transferase family protein n=1 Tax=Ketobacter sp. TaxID=2083498 RepID=UPI000F1E7AFB|nr:CoA transferase [Ketobacter sp.]RLT95662.1 MAG: CoA transferase [Ketobacter sp.]